MYNKLYTKILDSSIWLESDHVRLVWITFLAVMDQDGFVALSSVGNVALRARVTEKRADEAITCLESPDLKNPDQDYEGRRIERVPGMGWYVLNAAKYRDIMKAEEVRAGNRERQRELRARRKAEAELASNADVTDCHKIVTPSEAEAEAVTEEKKERNMSANADVSDIFQYWQTTLNHPNAKLTKERKKFIAARLAEKYDVEQIKSAIDGCKNSPYHMGVNDTGTVYDDLTLICRNGSKLEQFIGYNNRKELTNNGNGTPKTFRQQRNDEAKLEGEFFEELRRATRAGAARIPSGSDADRQRQLHAGSPDADDG